MNILISMTDSEAQALYLATLRDFAEAFGKQAAMEQQEAFITDNAATYQQRVAQAVERMEAILSKDKQI